jgi:predicted Rossmann fold nucleotide-binding protein DprA/Smf involved in DNA uptake
METGNHNEAAYWLALINHSGLKLAQIKPIAQQWHLMEGKSIAALFNLSATELSVRFSLTEAQAQGLLKAADSHAAQVNLIKTWQAQGIELITLSHPHFPGRLIYALPPKQQPLLLWARGSTQALLEPTVTFLGKPEPEPETIAFVNDLLPILVSENMGVVSGYGKGLDRIAFEGILENNEGQAMAVLPMGLAAFAKLTQKLDQPVSEGRAVLLSPFPPDVPFKDNLAEARNLLVDSLALALLVPQVDTDSQPRAEAALERGMPVLVNVTDSPENRALIDKGAILMTDPGEVIDMVQQAIIDDALQAELAQTPASEAAPPIKAGGSPMLDGEDDYALGNEPVDPLAADEALDILSSMGAVPDSLRERLQAIEEQQKLEAEERKGEGE